MPSNSSSLTTLLNNLKAGQLHTFHGGIHPPERKAPANLTPISDAGLPQELVLQVRQHIGQAAQLTVRVGERVLKGQALTEPLNTMMVPVHAPTSGIISAIEDRPLCHPSGLSGLCIVLKADGLDEWRPRFPNADYALVEPHALLTRIHQAGITGLGGAGFPAHVKLAAGLAVAPSPAQYQGIDTLIINGVECEPYISADDRLMREHPAEILQGIAILRHIIKPKLTILAVEDNKPEALAALHAAHQAAKVDDNLLIIAVPTKYPSGGQKQLIEVLTGVQVPQKSLSSDVGIIMQNVGTVFAIQQAIILDEPLIRRVITLAGEAFEQPGNAWVSIGTPVRYLLQRYGLKAEHEQRIIIGGPMMGFTLHSAAAPIIKGCNCVLAPKAAELSPPLDEMACIRCSKCAEACPVSLLPQQLYWYARSDEHDKLESHNLFDCIECGACAYVCPSHIPLVQYYRVAKADIRQTRHEAEQAERAKERFEARQARLTLEKEERQARQAQAAAERKARMAEQAAKTGEDPVAAALARVKARQLAENPEGNTKVAEDMTALRAARKEEARRNRALKAAQASEAEATAIKAKNPAVAAALARAKALREQQESHLAAQDPPRSPSDGEPKNTAPIDAKKAAIKAAVARAKERQAAELAAALAQSSGGAAATAQPIATTQSAAGEIVESAAVAESAESGDLTKSAAPVDAKKAAIQAAVARAKARKAAQTSKPSTAAAPAAEPSPVSGETVKSTAVAESGDLTESAAPVDAKKAAIQAAVARAKARKLAQTAAEPAESQQVAATADASSEPELDAAAAKQAAIQAAVARAKARKAALTATTPADAAHISLSSASLLDKEEQS